jgi:hypothetical protein
LKAGADVLHTPTSYDFGLVGEFENQADFLIYRDHPEHVKVARFVSDLTSDRVSLDFMFNPLSLFFELRFAMIG